MTVKPCLPERTDGLDSERQRSTSSRFRLWSRLLEWVGLVSAILVFAFVCVDAQAAETVSAVNQVDAGRSELALVVTTPTAARREKAE